MCVGGGIGPPLRPLVEARLRTGPMVVAGGQTEPCAGGTRIKPEILESQLWLTASDLCAGISWWATWFRGFCDQLLPQLVVLEDMCGSLPPTPPTIDLEQMAKDGTLFRLPNVLLEWLLVWWLNVNWNTYCECVDVDPCPPVAFSGTVSWAIASDGGNKLFQSVPRPAGTTSWQPTYTSWSNTIGANVWVVIQEIDASGGVIVGYTHQLQGRTPPYTPTAITFQAATTRLDLRLAQTNFATFPHSSSVAGSMGFVCSGGEPALPFVPPAEPPVPDVPPVPLPPATCTTEQLCVLVYEIQQWVLNLTINQNTSLSSSHRQWRDGVRHSNLREAGRLTFTAAPIGVRVEVTLGPEPPQLLGGDPPFYWNMGFITPLSDDVPLRGWRLVFGTQSFELPGVADGVSWTLLDGTEIDLVELLPV